MRDFRAERPAFALFFAVFTPCSGVAGGPPPGPALSLSAGGAALIRRDRSTVPAGEDVKAVDRHAFDDARRRPLRGPQRCRRRWPAVFQGLESERQNLPTSGKRVPAGFQCLEVSRHLRACARTRRARLGRGLGGAGNLRRRAGGSHCRSHSGTRARLRRGACWWVRLVPVGGLVGFRPPDFTPFVAFQRRREKWATCRKPLKTKGRTMFRPFKLVAGAGFEPATFRL